VPEVIIRTTHGERWLALREPTATLVAERPDGVTAVLNAAERAAAAGAFVAGFVSYEAAAAFGLAVHPPVTHVPLAWFGIFPTSHVEVMPDPPESDSSAGAPPAWTATTNRAEYYSTVAHIRELIADGHTYQLNHTYRMRADSAFNASALFRSLVEAQGGAWSAFIDTGDLAVCSASPELFFTRDGPRVVCRPMKGTFARGRWPAEDQAQAKALRASAKNRAENVMIVDLIRNDLGRIARPGTVTTPSLFDVERYPAQWQMTSTVEAHLESGIGLADIFSALFPSGSVTGAPKVRSMEIIRSVEATPRGVYCGAIGLIEPGGRTNFNVAIRTVVVDRATGRAEFGVGSGIVWDSRADSEFEECRLKAAILTAQPPDFELLESLRWSPAEGYSLLVRHIERMRQSADYFGFPFHEDQFRSALQGKSEESLNPAKIRILLNRRGAIRREDFPLTAQTSPMRVALALAPVSSHDTFLFHKTTRREVYTSAEDAQPGTDAIILWNEAGEITESTRFNIVAEIDDRRITPPVECGLLAGTMRAELLEVGTITERRITIEELRTASRLWLVNSVHGWVEAALE
jgi:para-aminobenzoate synthetase/4-amino-4-deoxychorismate lyase